ncbi:hypothetical protein P4O66_013943, partial [Electrophorus voltai]
MFNSKFMLKCTSGEVVHFPAYNGRVEFNKTTFSLTLKNLTKNDAGNYTVKDDDDEGENIIVVHTLTVLDPVVAPKLDFLPQQNKGTCNVTCESQGVSVSTSCYNEICEAKNKTSSDLNLSLHGNGTTVSCTVRIKAISKHTTQNVTVCFHKESLPISVCREEQQLQCKCQTFWTKLCSGSIHCTARLGYCVMKLKQKTVSNHEFKEVGSSVQLHIKGSIKPFKTLKWMHGKYFVLTYDQKLNKVEPGRAYNDPVESPILTPVPHQLSSDPCNVTLTCSGHNLTIHSNCSNDVCEENKIESPGGIILSMYVSGSTIICNHSNPVSWKKSAIKEIKEICFSI